MIRGILNCDAVGEASFVFCFGRLHDHPHGAFRNDCSDKALLCTGRRIFFGIIQKANSQVQDGILEELSYDDGGTAVYRYPDYTIIKYHTLDGNRDVYILSPDVDVAVPL